MVMEPNREWFTARMNLRKSAVWSMAFAAILLSACGNETAPVSKPEGGTPSPTHDSCANLEGVQSGPPPGYTYDDQNACVVNDVQGIVPDSSTGTSTDAAAVIEALLESKEGHKLRVHIQVGAPVPAPQAYDSPLGEELRDGCSHPNLDFWYQDSGTQVVPVSWTASDETPGDFEWDPYANVDQLMVMPDFTPVAGDSLPSALVSDCDSDRYMPFGPGRGVIFPFSANAYTPKNPQGGFAVTQLVAGVKGNVVECEVSMSGDPFEGRVTTVDQPNACGITATGEL